MKKITALALLSSLMAAPLVAQAGCWEGNWLLGVSGAYNWFENDFDVSVNIPGVPLAFSANDDFSTQSWMWGLLGGYQVRNDEWLIGAELNVDWDGESHHSRNNAFATTVAGRSINANVGYKRETTIGLTARLGYQVSCWFLPYLRAGVETSRDKYDVSITDSGVAAAAFNGETSERSYRFVGGVGFELPVPVCAGLSFRGEYNYHSRNKALDLTGPWSGQVATSSSNAHNHTNTAKVSIVYNFGA